MQPENIEKIEVELFLQAIYQRYGYDFRSYAKASIRRRTRHLLAKTGLPHITTMIPRMLYDEEFAHSIISDFSITVTEMFRDPDFYRAVRQIIVPYLRTYPFFKVWHAGCATGEEVYSLAILLKEEGLYDRATIFATDFNDLALKRAQEGIYALRNIQQYTTNYQKAGGQRPFSDYYHAEYESAIMEPSLKQNITFANHNLVTDSVFSEIHLVFCRNVLIYFDKSLQSHVLKLLNNSLSFGGFLCLGSKETLQFSEVQNHFQALDQENRIYRKQSAT